MVSQCPPDGFRHPVTSKDDAGLVASAAEPRGRRSRDGLRVCSFRGRAEVPGPSIAAAEDDDEPAQRSRESPPRSRARRFRRRRARPRTPPRAGRIRGFTPRATCPSGQSRDIPCPLRSTGADIECARGRRSPRRLTLLAAKAAGLRPTSARSRLARARPAGLPRVLFRPRVQLRRSRSGSLARRRAAALAGQVKGKASRSALRARSCGGGTPARRAPTGTHVHYNTTPRVNKRVNFRTQEEKPRSAGRVPA